MAKPKASILCGNRTDLLNQGTSVCRRFFQDITRLQMPNLWNGSTPVQIRCHGPMGCGHRGNAWSKPLRASNNLPVAGGRHLRPLGRMPFGKLWTICDSQMPQVQPSWWGIGERIWHMFNTMSVDTPTQQMLKMDGAWCCLPQCASPIPWRHLQGQVRGHPPHLNGACRLVGWKNPPLNGLHCCL